MPAKGTANGKIGRPATEPSGRHNTAIRFRPEVWERLQVAAEEREVSMNWLVNKAVADYLDRLIPVDEIKWTRD